MTDERDPALQALFAETDRDLPAEAFVAGVIERADRQKRRAIVVRILAGLLVAVCAWLLASPLQEGAALLTRGLATPLLDPGNPLLGQLLLPVNSVAGLVALAIIGLRAVRRHLFG